MSGTALALSSQGQHLQACMLDQLGGELAAVLPRGLSL